MQIQFSKVVDGTFTNKDFFCTKTGVNNPTKKQQKRDI